MSYLIKDLKNLIHSEEFQEFQGLHQRQINIGEKVYTRRKDLDMTQKYLSFATGIPQNKISQIETATYGELGIERIKKLSEALKMPLEYLFYDTIDRKTLEVYNYILSKLENVPDIMQFMKLPYFIDLELIKNNFKQATNFEYIRWNYGPFDKKVYNYQSLFSFDNEKGIDNLKFIYLSDDERKIIDETLVKLPKNNGEELKKLSYQTKPMQSIGATLGGNEHMGRLLEL